jgi:Big-like domain-containing protein/FG-GAP repeat protein
MGMELTFDSGGVWNSSIAVGDLNKDGKPDLVVVNGNVGVLLNNSQTQKRTTATTLTSSLNPSVYGQKVIFTATVTTTGPVLPTGTVGFMWRYFTQTYTIATTTLNSAGVATLTKSNLNAGPYPVIAVYRGDTNNLSSTSAVMNQPVLQTTSAATITSSVNPSMVGQAVTFTAKIISPTGIPSGPVTFKAGTTVLGTAQLNGGKAIFTTSTVPASSTMVKVTYNGNSNIKGSSASVTQTVQP